MHSALGKISIPNRIAFFLIVLTIIGHTTQARDFNHDASLDRNAFTILILHSYHKGFRWTDSIEKGVRETLKQALPHVNILTEHMDTKRHFDAFHWDNLTRLYRHKFQKKDVDLIISSDDNAFNFLRQKGQEIFGQVPVVFCGVNYFQDDMLQGLPYFTGVVEAFDIRRTLDAALAFHPETRQVAVVVDQTPTGLSSLRRLNSLPSTYAERCNFLLFDDLGMEELLKRLESLPIDSLVLLLNFNRDRNGRVFSHMETIERLRRSAKVPIYGVWDFFVGQGIVGGMITSGRSQGATAADLAVRILRGEHPAAVGVVTQSPNRWMFDHHELARFKLLDAKLPSDSLVINRPASFYEVNKKIIWGLTAAVLFLGLSTVVLTVNIIARQRAQAQLRDTTERLAALLEALPIVPFATTPGPGGTFVYVSRAVSDITGYQPEQFTDEKTFWAEQIHPDDRKAVLTKVFEGGPFRERLMYRFLTFDGQYRWFSDTRRPMSYLDGGQERVVGFWQDITSEVKLRREADQRLQQVIQADKLTSLGEMVAGVAHEIRNPNAFISTNLPLLRETWGLLRPMVERSKPDHRSGLDMAELGRDMDDMLDDIGAGSERIDRIVRELKAFARASETEEMQPVNLNEVVEKAQVLVGVQIRKTFSHFTLNLDPDLPQVYGHFTRLEQVVTNLVVNATQAVRKDVEAGLKISTRRLAEPEAVLLQVEDNGQGIAPELRERIFEPFFTTRRETGGTGLGLSVCYRLVGEHQGAIFLVSRPGWGSRFTVALPCEPGRPLVMRPTLLWVDRDPKRLKRLKALAHDPPALHLRVLENANDLAFRLNELPQVVSVCLAMHAQNGGVSKRLKELAEIRPLVTRVVYCERENLEKVKKELENLTDTVLADPLTSELLQHMTRLNIRKIL